MSSNTKLSVGIVTYNSSKDISKCLETLQMQNLKNVDLHIYVFDNLSPDSDKTRAIVEKSFPNVTLVKNGSNAGFGHGHNAIINDAVSDFHLILNADIEFKTETLGALVQYLLDNNDVALVTPEIRNTDGTVQHLPKKFPKIHYVLSSTIPFFSKYRDAYTRANESLNEPTEMEISTGCFMLTRTSQLKEIGGFDDRFFLYFEDFDLSMRLRKFGKLIYYPAVEATHLWHRDSKRSRKVFMMQIKSMLQFYGKWGLKG